VFPVVAAAALDAVQDHRGNLPQQVEGRARFSQADDDDDASWSGELCHPQKRGARVVEVMKRRDRGDDIERP
jgi:hypothetical protein